MKGGKRTGAGRKKRADHLRREIVTIRLPQWLITQLKEKGEMGYLIEGFLVNTNYFNLPEDYKKGS